MYTSGWLLGIAQALLLWNWVVALAGLASFALLYFLRVRREEQMMLDRFGEAYRAHIEQDGDARLNGRPVLRTRREHVS